MNPSNLINMYQQLKANPMQMLSRRFNLPQNINNPNDIIQHLLDTGQVSQEQLNNAMTMANSPQFKNMMK